MTEPEALRALAELLDAAEIERGSTVYLGVDMARVPLPDYPATLERSAIRRREVEWCAFLLDVLQGRVGVEGTLLAPTFSYAYARTATPYFHETSPSETGAFTEFFRTRPGVVRSFHPLNSISGVGPNARAILEDVGRAGYGARSPFARLRAFDTRFLFLGAPLGITLTYAHHLEHMYGVNHMYHKVYSVPAHREGRPEPGPWTCFVRYLGVGIEAGIGRLEEELRSSRLLKEAAANGRIVQSVGVADVERVGYAMLDRDPCAFLAEPVRITVGETGAADQPLTGRTVRLILTA